MRTIVRLFCTVLLFCTVVLVDARDPDECVTENMEEGVCVNIDKCFALKGSTKKLGDSPKQLEIIERERKKCADDEFDQNLVCCKKNPPVKSVWTFEDSKPLKYPVTDVLPDAKDCGKYDGDRIFVGNVTDPEQFPWMVLFSYINNGIEEFNCAGSLISKRYVLTAAHCVTSNMYKAVIGEWDLETDPDCVVKYGELVCAPPKVEIGIEKIHIHTNYTRLDSEGGKVDMALIRLDQDVTFNDYVRPICLATNDAQAVLNKIQYVSGWGLTENYTTSPKKLFTVLDLVQRDQCIKAINTIFIKIDDTVICAHGKDGRDACSGDSGGPLMQLAPAPLGNFKVARMFLTGVISGGLSCGSPRPAFYTNVYTQLNWIVSNME